MSARKRLLSIGSGTMLLLAITIAAWAYLSANGAGSGEAATTTISSPVVTASTPSAGAGHVSWTAVLSPANTSGENAEVSYLVERGTSATGPWVDANNTCSGTLSSTVLACDDSPSTGGTYFYRVTAHFRSWTSFGVSNSVIIVTDSTPPTAVITFPANATAYKASTYNAGCSPTGICGTAADASGVASLRASIKRNSDNTYWNGTAFTGTTESFNAATLGSPNAGSTTWTYGFAIPADGSYTIHVQATDTYGNAQTGTTYAASSTFTIDTTLPVVTLTAPVNNSLTNNNTPTFSGACTTGDGSVTVLVKQGATTVQTRISACAAGSYSVAASPALSDGNYTAQASQTDAASNTGSSSTNTFTVDTTLPAVTLTAPANDSFMNNTTPTFSGTCTTSDGSVTVVVKQGASTIQTRTSACGAGTYSVAASPALTQGTYAAQASQTDAANNTGSSSTITFTIDTTLPVVTLTSPANNSLTNGATPTFTGVCTNGDGTVTVLVKQGASTIQTRTTACSSGSYTVAASPALADGGYTAQASQTDAAGNIGSSSTNTFSVDATRPTVTDVTISGGVATKAEAGDIVVITYSETVSATSICSSWVNDGTTQLIAGNNDGGGNNGAFVSVNDNAVSGSDSVTFNMGTGCTGGGHIGSINLGSSAYVTATVSFHGNGTGKMTTYSYNPSTKKLTITLGQANGGTVCTSSCPATSNATTTPDPLIADVAGNTITGTFSKNSSQF